VAHELLDRAVDELLGTQDGVIAFRVRDGKIAEGREFFQDTAKGDAFWA
jgi:ketosteroid isomerase-like protein